MCAPPRVWLIVRAPVAKQAPTQVPTVPTFIAKVRRLLLGSRSSYRWGLKPHPCLPARWFNLVIVCLLTCSQLCLLPGQPTPCFSRLQGAW